MTIIQIKDNSTTNNKIKEPTNSISSKAMIMYALLRLRFGEAQKNNLRDENGEVFCHYTINEFRNVMKLSEYQVVHCKRELCQAGLMREVYVLGLASRLYVKDGKI